jgi:hypothetical protein
VSGQILDDSTRLVYGPHTTKYILEEDIYNDVPVYFSPDTTLNYLYNFHLLYNRGEIYQNLGNFGTPLGRIYYNPVQNIGRNFGFNVFDPYAFHPSRVKYFDTRSPYSEIRYRQSATGIQFGEAFYTRNIKPNWNAGFHVKRFTSNKTIGIAGRSDRQSDHTSFLFFTRYFTKDSSYQVLSNFSVMEHKDFETGGVVQDSTESLEDLFNYRIEDIRFRSARAMEKRLAFHLYHQYKPVAGIQFFHVFDWYSQSNRFRNAASESGYFPGRPDSVLINKGSSVDDRTDFRLMENKAGIKGYAGRFYYHLYYRRKDFSYDHDCDSCATKNFVENFAGGDIRFYVFDSAFVKLQAEYLIGRDYLINGTIRSKWLSAGYSRLFHSPALLQLSYTGDRYYWNNENEFSNVTVNNFWAKAEADLKALLIQPGLNFSIIKNYIYFDTLAVPRQDDSTIRYASADLFFRIKISRFRLENFTRYAYALRIINVPEIFNHSRIYLESWLFKKALLAQIGFDLFYRSRYYANAYMPITQQFYLNNNFPVESFLTGDIFLNVKVKSVIGFVKMSNVNQANYFITPWYPGMPRNFEFGIRWMFFD